MSTAKVQGQNQKDTVAGATQVTKNVRLILLQEDISTIKEIKNLPTHQKAAKGQSTEWVNDIWPLIIQTTTEIIDYANTFQSTYEGLLTLVPKLEKGDKQAKDDFVQALQVVLIPNLQDKTKTAKSIADSIKIFHAKFEPLYHSFLEDFTQADKVLTKDKTDVIAIKADLAKWHVKALAYEITMTTMAVALPCTAAATVAWSATGVGLIVGGIIFVGELAVLGTMLGLYADARKKEDDLTNQLHTLEKQVAQLTAIEQQISSLQKYTETIVTTSANVADGWIALNQELEETVKCLETITPEDAAFIIKVDLSTANKDWKTVLDQAKVLQPNGGRLDEKIFKTSDDMLKVIKAQAAGA